MHITYIYALYICEGGKEKGREGRKKGRTKTESMKGKCWSCQQAGVEGKETEDRWIN